jgi:hypothetical protein
MSAGRKNYFFLYFRIPSKMSERYKSDGKIVVMVFSQTAPIYPPGSYRDENQQKRTEVENKDIGTKVDVDVICLKNFFKSLFGKRVTIINKSSQSFEETVNLIKEKLQQATEDEYDCFWFVFLTYVDDKGRLQFYGNEKDDLQPLEKIIDTVKDIPVTRGKPKIFLVQSDDMTLDKPITLTKGTEPVPARVQVKIPTDADRLVIQSTIPQKLARKESFLIQAFVKALKENNARPTEHRDDLLSLTTVINKIVADLVDPLTEERKREGKDDLPVPLTTSTLTKLLYF